VTTAFDRLKAKLEDDSVKLRLKANYMDAKELTATATPVAEFNLQKNDVFGKRGGKQIKDNAKEALKKFTTAYNNLGRQLVLSDMTLIKGIISDYNHNFNDYHDDKKGNRDRRIALQMLNQIHREILDCYYETSAVYLKLEAAINESVYITERLEGLKIDTSWYPPTTEDPTNLLKTKTRRADPLKELYRQAKQLAKVTETAKATEFEDLYESVKDMGKRLTAMEKDVQKPKEFLENYWKCWADIGKAIEDYARALELAELFMVKLNIVDRLGYGLGQTPLLDGKKNLGKLLDTVYAKLNNDRTALEYGNRTPFQQRSFDAAKGKASGELAEQKESASYYTEVVKNMSEPVNFPQEWKTDYPDVY